MASSSSSCSSAEPSLNNNKHQAVTSANKKLVTIKLSDGENCYSLVVDEEICKKANECPVFAKNLLENYKAIMGQNDVGKHPADTAPLPSIQPNSSIPDDGSRVVKLSDGVTSISLSLPQELYQQAVASKAYRMELFQNFKNQQPSEPDAEAQEALKENSSNAVAVEYRQLSLAYGLNTYTFPVSAGDHARAMTDMIFATQLLQTHLASVQAPAAAAVVQSLPSIPPSSRHVLQPLQDVNNNSNQELELNSDSDKSTVERHNWTREKTLQLLRSYKKYEEDYLEGNLKYNQMMVKIKNDINVDVNKCSTRIDTLKREYRKKVNEKTGDSWEYFKICHDLFKNRAWLKNDKDKATTAESSGVKSEGGKIKGSGVILVKKQEKEISEIEKKKIELIKRRLDQEDRKIDNKNTYQAGKLAALNRIAEYFGKKDEKH